MATDCDFRAFDARGMRAVPSRAERSEGRSSWSPKELCLRKSVLRRATRHRGIGALGLSGMRGQCWFFSNCLILMPRQLALRLLGRHAFQLGTATSVASDSSGCGRAHVAAVPHLQAGLAKWAKLVRYRRIAAGGEFPRTRRCPRNARGLGDGPRSDARTPRWPHPATVRQGLC